MLWKKDNVLLEHLLILESDWHWLNVGTTVNCTVQQQEIKNNYPKTKIKNYTNRTELKLASEAH